MSNKPIVIAVAGKGGVGKTSLASVMVKLLVSAHPDKRILAIDADPAVGLSTALGVEPELTLDDIRREAVDAAENGDTKATVEVLGEARYRIFDAMVEMLKNQPETIGLHRQLSCAILSGAVHHERGAGHGKRQPRDCRGGQPFQ